MTTTKEVVLDDRRRTSLARIGLKDHDRYLAEERPDGTIILKPAVLVTQTELDLLRNPAFRAALDQVAGPNPTLHRRKPPAKRPS